MTDKFADINGIKLCYEILGKEDGYPILLVHGFGVKKEIWMSQIDDLSEEFKVIRFDNRGAGKSDRPEGNYTMETFADDTKKLLDYLDIKKTHIMGWSLGGMIVQNFIIKYPEMINKIILIATNYGFPDAQGPEIYKRMRLREVELLKEDPAKAFWETARTNFYSKYRKQMEKDPTEKFFNTWSAEDFIKLSTINPPTSKDIMVQAEALKTHNVFDELKDVKNEVLLIAASHDRLTPKSSMEEMHQQLPNSTLITIEKSGHFAPMTRTPEVNNVILKFLRD